MLPVHQDVYKRQAVATAKAIEDVSNKKADIKWVNDIYIEGKKVCGILTEAAFNIETSKLDYAIVGIGINVCPPEGGFPEDISGIATAIFEKNSDAVNKRSILVGHLLNYFMEYYELSLIHISTYHCTIFFIKVIKILFFSAIATSKHIWILTIYNKNS